jgi:type II secretory pathway component PulC
MMAGYLKSCSMLTMLAMVGFGMLPATSAAEEQRLAGTLENDGTFLAIVEDGGRQWLLSTGEMLGECRVGEVSATVVRLKCPDGFRELRIRALPKRGATDDVSGEATYLSIQKVVLERLINDRQELVNQFDLAPEVDETGTLRGWRVVSVRAGSEVEALGLQTGDLITSVNHVAVADSVFMEALRSVPEQGLVNLSLQRQQRNIELIYSLH